MRFWRLLILWGLLGAAFAVLPAQPASACSYDWQYAPPPVRVAPSGSVPSGGSTSTTEKRLGDAVLYTGVVSAVGEGWMKITPDYVAEGTPPSRLKAKEYGTSMCWYDWRASDFDVGWPVLVGGRLYPGTKYEQSLTVIDVPSLADESASLRSLKGEMKPLSGEGAPAIVVGGRYGDSTAVVLDGQGRPLHYVHGTVTAQVLAPCPDSQLVVVAGTNVGADDVERYAVEVLDTSTGSTSPVVMTDIGPFDRDDGTYPWVVRCNDSGASAIEVSTAWHGWTEEGAPRDPEQKPTRPRAGKHGERVTFTDEVLRPFDADTPFGAAPMPSGTLTFWNNGTVIPDGGEGWVEADLRWYPRDGSAWRAVTPGIAALAVTRVRDPALGPMVAYEKFWPDDVRRTPSARLASTSESGWFATYRTSALLAAVVAGLFVGALKLAGRRRGRASAPDPAKTPRDPPELAGTGEHGPDENRL